MVLCGQEWERGTFVFNKSSNKYEMVSVFIFAFSEHLVFSLQQHFFFARRLPCHRADALITLRACVTWRKKKVQNCCVKSMYSLIKAFVKRHAWEVSKHLRLRCCTLRWRVRRVPHVCVQVCLTVLQVLVMRACWRHLSGNLVTLLISMNFMHYSSTVHLK